MKREMELFVKGVRTSNQAKILYQEIKKIEETIWMLSQRKWALEEKLGKLQQEALAKEKEAITPTKIPQKKAPRKRKVHTIRLDKELKTLIEKVSKTENQKKALMGLFA